MRLIICGGRDFQDHELLHVAVTDWVAQHGCPAEVVTGGQRGADTLAHQLALAEGLPTRVFEADWTRYRKRAGPIRNGEMARYAAQGGGGCLALPGGRGTADMLEQARAAGLTIMDVGAMGA
jgi:hypothetical protein